MGIFNFIKKKKDQTEFVRDPLAFIRFLREDNEELAGFGQTSLAAAGEEVINPMIKLLTDEKEDKKVRRRAGNVLSRIGIPAIAPLIDVLKRQEFNSKLSAETIGMIAAALGGIGKDAVDPLIREMGSEFRQVRFGVAVALVQTGDAKAIQSVRNAALHGDPEDRQMFKMVMGE